MQSPSHLRGWGSHLRQEEGQGHRSNGGRGWGRGGRREAAEPRARPWGAGRGGRRPGSLQPRPPGGLPRSEGRGRGARQKPSPRGPSRRAPPHPPRGLPARPSRRQHLPRGCTAAPSLPPPPQSFCPGSGASTACPEPPSFPLPPPRPRALTRPSLDAAAEPEPRGGLCPRPGPGRPSCDPRGRGVPGAGLWLPARPLGSYRRSHSGGSCPGAVGGRPRGTRELGRGGVGGGVRRPPPPRPRPARRAHLSCQGPAAPPRLTHAGATVAQCLSKLLISPGAARRPRRRLGPAGEVELPGPRPRNTCCCRRRRGHTQAQRRPLPGHWLAPGSLTSASGRCRVSAANTHARAHGQAPGSTRAGTGPSPARSAR